MTECQLHRGPRDVPSCQHYQGWDREPWVAGFMEKMVQAIAFDPSRVILIWRHDVVVGKMCLYGGWIHKIWDQYKCKCKQMSWVKRLVTGEVGNFLFYSSSSTRGIARAGTDRSPRKLRRQHIPRLTDEVHIFGRQVRTANHEVYICNLSRSPQRRAA
jgi:hypothetical protein